MLEFNINFYNLEELFLNKTDYLNECYTFDELICFIVVKKDYFTFKEKGYYIKKKSVIQIEH